MCVTIRNRIVDLLDDQVRKGSSKYGHTLDECQDKKFDFDRMLQEELIDALQYKFKLEDIEKKRLNNLLEDAIAKYQAMRYMHINHIDGASEKNVEFLKGHIYGLCTVLNMDAEKLIEHIDSIEISHILDCFA